MVFNKDFVAVLRDAVKSNVISNMFETEAEMLLMTTFDVLNEAIVKNFQKNFKKKMD